MYKLLFLFFLTLLNISANEKIEIYATKVETKDGIVNASGDVAVVYKGYYLSASKAIYNKNTGELELIDDVRANQGNEYKLLGNHAKLNIKTKEKSFQPFYMLEKESKVWISGDSCKAKDNDFDIASGVVSGCNPNDPLWKIEFSSSEYNTESKWLNLYNARLYIYDIPVFYTPWFGYPLDKTRRTGLLKPSFGVSGVEGLYYQQPFYIAEDDAWDLELTPQIRTKRGEGIYSTFRFVDSNVSKGSLRGGYFKEHTDYFLANNLANDKHYGYNFKYENSDVINQWFGVNLDGQSGLYIDGNFMNDVDYINLSSNETINISTTTQVLSRINLFYNTDKNYFASYFKHYIDLTKDSNDDTLQKLPTIHYHHYLETLLDGHLTYNTDIQSNNIHREINQKVVQTDFNMPVSLHTSILNEYIDLDYTTNLYAQHSAFYGSEITSTGLYEDGIIARNNNVVGVSTQLTKAYEEFSHVMGFGSSYTFKGAETTSGFYDYNKDYCENLDNKSNPNYISRCEFYNILEVKEELKLNFSQYLYDSLGNQKLYHRLSQTILYTGVESSKGDLENELEYKITDHLDIYNNMFYNHKQEKFSKIYNSLVYNDDGFDILISHLYQDTFIPSTATILQYTDYLTSGIKYKYNKHYAYHFAYDYDLELKEKKRTEIGFLYSKRCWDFGMKYVENNRPVLDATGNTQGIKERYIYFTISLKPFMSTGSTDSSLFAYKLPNEE
ncbi:MAG: LPS-assembly protein [Sulfurimonas sp.]|jgi:LPS-assembly protein|uniref:LPS-assembly protein LptD n=1 Tax=Sulfurimonas sp. TaxID=2022749 RepID=UPI0039E42283